MTPEQAARYLDALEPLGMNFGLERINRLVAALGMPQHRYATIHVVGTNGKSAVTEMIAVLLEAHGIATGAYLSPHFERWAERVQVAGAEIGAEAFAAAVTQVAETAVAVERSLDEGERMTQFEIATSAAFLALATARVKFGVIEAGLGGRLDATNVIPSKVTVLTSIGLEHTQWLGDTIEAIAAEKLAVLRPHTALVIGELPAAAEELARRTAAERFCELIVAGELEPLVEFESPVPYLRRDFNLAVAAAGTALGELDRARTGAVAAALDLHGRMEVLATDPPTIIDAAHNPEGAAALAEALPPIAAGRPVYCALAVLADKDAAGILAAFAPQVAALVATEIPAERLARAGRPGATTLSARELAAAALAAGAGQVEELTDPLDAVARVRTLAAANGGIALICGSHYLLRYA